MTLANAEQQFHPVQRTGNLSPDHLPASVALRAYEVYSAVFGQQLAMIDVEKGCRGGFSANEIVAFLYARSFPREEWSRRVDEALCRRPR